MSEQMGLLEFFSMEASEYLERLDALVSREQRPDTEEFVRLSRALRGSALMAKQRGFAGAAAALENLARAVNEGRRPWDEATRQLTISTVESFKTFLRSVSQWSSTEDHKAESIAEELDRVAGRSSAAHRVPVDAAPDAGTRAFVGREAAAVAAAMAQAAKELQQDPTGMEPVRRAVSQMQSLRGVAGLREMAPLPDLLDGMELAAQELERRRGNVPDGALVINAAAQALGRVAQEIATLGRADEDAPELHEFARRLRKALDLDASVVPIETLYHDDGGPHIEREGVRPARPGELERLEFVAHGEHLEQAAAEMERATSAAQRDLRAQTLTGTLRALASTSGNLFHDTVARFAHIVRDAIARGMATERASEFAHALRRAAALLREDGDVDAQTATLREIMQPLVGFGGQRPATSPASTAAARPHDAPFRRPPAMSVMNGQTPTGSPIAGRIPSVTTAVSRVPAGGGTPFAVVTPVAASVDEPATLAGSWKRYERYAVEFGLEGGALDELFAGPPTDPAAAPAKELQAVPVDGLLYRGRAALDRAHELRARVETDLEDGTSTSSGRELIQEVLDLVELARTQE